MRSAICAAMILLSSIVLSSLAGCMTHSSPPPAASAAMPAKDGEMCGAYAGIQCGEGLYCATAEHCGSGDQAGVCKTKPEVCTMQFEQVCGCDTKSYGNACEAARVGVSVAHTGPCT